MKYEVKFTSQFKKDFKRVKRRNLDLIKFFQVIKMLAEGTRLPEEYRDHPLMGDYKGARECHIKADWLLIYKVFDDTVVLELTRTGSHSDLF